jgi:hypothetical protein
MRSNARGPARVEAIAGFGCVESGQDKGGPTGLRGGQSWPILPRRQLCPVFSTVTLPARRSNGRHRQGSDGSESNPRPEVRGGDVSVCLTWLTENRIKDRARRGDLLVGLELNVGTELLGKLRVGGGVRERPEWFLVGCL